MYVSHFPQTDYLFNNSLPLVYILRATAEKIGIIANPLKLKQIEYNYLKKAH